MAVPYLRLVTPPPSTPLATKRDVISLTISVDLPTPESSALEDPVLPGDNMKFRGMPIHDLLPGCEASDVNLLISAKEGNLVLLFRDAATELQILAVPISISEMQRAIDAVDESTLAARRIMSDPNYDPARLKPEQREALSRAMADSLTQFCNLFAPVRFSDDVYNHLFERFAKSLGTVRHNSPEFG
jgi:hypothetical protein